MTVLRSFYELWDYTLAAACYEDFFKIEEIDNLNRCNNIDIEFQGVHVLFTVNYINTL